jgi:hypothetical protein
MSSDKAFLSGVRSFFALLNTRSHSVDIAGQDKVSRAYGVSVEGRKGRDSTSPPLDWVERGVGVFKVYRCAGCVFNEFILFGLRVLCTDPVSEGEWKKSGKQLRQCCEYLNRSQN